MPPLSEQFRVVIDTNLLISGSLLKKGKPYELLRQWRRGQFTLITSTAQIGEVVDVINRPKARVKYHISSDEIDLLADDLTVLSSHVKPSFPSLVPLRDPDDETILMMAINGLADFLVTGNLDLLVVASDLRRGALRIVSVAMFLALLDPGPEDAGLQRA